MTQGGWIFADDWRGDRGGSHALHHAAGNAPHRRHSRHGLSGIHLGFLSDGYPPLPMTAGASSETAGMTAKRWIPVTNCGYDE